MANPQQTTAELMTAYLDRELDPVAAEEFERFLAGSPTAQEELAELRKFVHLVGALQPVEAPAGFAERIGRKIRRRQAVAGYQGWMGLVTVPFQVISVIVILTVAAIYMLAQLDQRPRAIEPPEPTRQVDGQEGSVQEPLRPIAP